MFESVVTALMSPFVYLGTAEKRVYAPAMLVALVLAIWVYRRQNPPGQRSWRDVWARIFQRDIWLGASARLDYLLLITNAVVRVWLNAAALVPVAGVAALVSLGMDAGFGGEATWELSRRSIAIIYTLSLFVVGDLSRYLLHRLFHRVPALWELHQVHHSATTMTPFTVYRMHPIESFLFGLRGVLVSGGVTGLFYFVFRGELHAVDLLGVNVLGLAFNILGANLRHSHVWLSYGPRVEYFLLSPAQHQIHHSVDVKHHDRNFGSCFAFWDWIFGTLYVTEEKEEIQFGVEEVNVSHRWWDAVVGSWVRSGRILFRLRNSKPRDVDDHSGKVAE